MHLKNLVANSRAAKGDRADVGSGKLKRRPKRGELRHCATQTVADDHDAIRRAAFGHLQDHLHHAARDWLARFAAIRAVDKGCVI